MFSLDSRRFGLKTTAKAPSKPFWRKYPRFHGKVGTDAKFCAADRDRGKTDSHALLRQNIAVSTAIIDSFLFFWGLPWLKIKRTIPVPNAARQRPSGKGNALAAACGIRSLKRSPKKRRPAKAALPRWAAPPSCKRCQKSKRAKLIACRPGLANLTARSAAASSKAALYCSAAIRESAKAPYCYKPWPDFRRRTLCST